MPRFLAPITVGQETVTGTETISGNQIILSGTYGKDSYWTTVSASGGLSASHGNFTNNLIVSGGDSSQWNSTYSTVCANSAQWTVVDWMTLVRGYNTTPTLLATIGTGDVYTYVYNSSPSNVTYYRYIATDGTVDAFYTYYSGSTLSGLVASKSITI